MTAYYAMVTVNGSGLQVASISCNSFCCPKTSQALANQLAPCPGPLHPILSFQFIGPGTTMPQMEITIVYGCSEENKGWKTEEAQDKRLPNCALVKGISEIIGWGDNVTYLKVSS